MSCDFCAGPAKGRFCSDKHRAAWHREYDPQGIVRNVRRLANGGTAVVLHFADRDAERALHFQIKQSVVMGAITTDTTTTNAQNINTPESKP
jgi:hypothetical protein